VKVLGSKQVKAEGGAGAAHDQGLPRGYSWLTDRPKGTKQVEGSRRRLEKKGREGGLIGRRAGLREEVGMQATARMEFDEEYA
jgi:hypothetical protein